MTTDALAEAKVNSAVENWAHALGVCDERPIHAATAHATVALRRGATVGDACSVARSYVISWIRHPSNAGRYGYHAA